MVEIKHKRGDSIVWECEYLDDVGNAVDITSYVINIQIKSEDDTFDVSSGVDKYDATNGLFRVTVEDTSTYKVGTYRTDIQYTIGNIIRSSETFKLDIVQDITQ